VGGVPAAERRQMAARKFHGVGRVVSKGAREPGYLAEKKEKPGRSMRVKASVREITAGGGALGPGREEKDRGVPCRGRGKGLCGGGSLAGSKQYKGGGAFLLP